MEGILKLRGEGAIAALVKKWCILTPHHMDIYFEKGNTFQHDDSKISIDLRNGDAVPSVHLPFGFDVIVSGHSYQFQASSEAERDHWIQEIRARRNQSNVNLTLPGGETDVYTVQCQSTDLVRKDNPALHQVDTYFTIHSNMHPDGTGKSLVYKSEVIAQNSNPLWDPFDLDPEMFGGVDTNFELTVFDLSTNGASTQIGTISTTLRAFVSPNAHFDLFGAEDKGDITVLSVTPKGKTQPYKQVKSVVITPSAMSLDARNPDTYLVFKALPKALSAASGSGRQTIIQRTEVIMKSTNPTWQRIELQADVCGGLDAAITIECYETHPTNKHDLVGSCTISLRDAIVCASPQYYLVSNVKTRPGYRNSGILSLTIDAKHYTPAPSPPPTTTYAIKLCGKALANPDGKMDSFFIIRGSPSVAVTHPHRPTATRINSCLIYKSEIIPKSTNPNWALVKLSINLCGSLDNALYIEVYDYEDGSGKLIGSVTSSLRELSMNTQPTLMLLNKQMTYTGQVVVQDATQEAAQEFEFPHPTGYTIRCTAVDVERAAGALGLSKSAPLLIVKGTPYDQPTQTTLYKSEVIQNTTKPSWKPFSIDLDQAGGMDSHLVFECYNSEAAPTGSTSSSTSSPSQLIGTFTTSLRELTMYKNLAVFALVHPQKSRIGHKNSGLVKFEEVTENYSPDSQQTSSMSSLSLASSHSSSADSSSLSTSPNSKVPLNRSNSPTLPQQAPYATSIPRPQLSPSQPVQPAASSAAYLHPHSAMHHGTSPTHQTTSVRNQPPSPTHVENYNKFGEAHVTQAPLRTSAVYPTNNNPALSLRTSATGQFPTPGEPQSPTDTPTLSTSPPSSTPAHGPLRSSSDHHSPNKKKDGASGGLALAGQVATAIGTPFLYGIR